MAQSRPPATGYICATICETCRTDHSINTQDKPIANLENKIIFLVYVYTMTELTEPQRV